MKTVFSCSSSSMKSDFEGCPHSPIVNTMIQQRRHIKERVVVRMEADSPNQNRESEVIKSEGEGSMKV